MYICFLQPPFLIYKSLNKIMIPTKRIFVLQVVILDCGTFGEERWCFLSVQEILVCAVYVIRFLVYQTFTTKTELAYFYPEKDEPDILKLATQLLNSFGIISFTG